MVPCLLWAQKTPIYQSDKFTLYADGVVQGAYVANAVSDTVLTSSFENRTWHWQGFNKNYPEFSCNIPISNTLYRMAVDELGFLVEKDTTWRTGKWWGGVWTRDVSYSSLLSVAYMNPEVTRNSLLRKVRNGRIVEDTGTGGSWPVSTDRIVWTLAAWQLYLVTGDREWLEQSYSIIRNTILQDELVVFDAQTGLVRGESSFLDWREETYPRWMQPADIAMSECLGTNAVYFRACQVASRMAELCGDRANALHFQEVAETIKKGINEFLWLEDKGYYAQYLYGRGHLIPSPRSETLGEALCVIFGIADSIQARRIVASVPQNPFGTPCISPQIPNIYPYHNNAVWPFVQSYWMWASAVAGNQASVLHSMAAIYRAAALFATNQENFVVTTGDYHTAMNSPNMLWSIAGNLSLTHRILMGLNFEEEGLRFAPFVPEAWKGEKKMTFHYRKSELSIIVDGFGDSVTAFYIDGKKQAKPIFPNNKKGYHTVRVVMNDAFNQSDTINYTPVVTSPETTHELYLEEANRLAWRQVPNVKHYLMLRDGVVIDTLLERIINGNLYAVPMPDCMTEYQVIAVDSNGVEGFASEPLRNTQGVEEMHLDMAQYAEVTQLKSCKGYSGMGAVEINSDENTVITMKVDIPQSGYYQVDFRYANGSNSLTQSNCCAVRTLRLNGTRQGCILFPQRGTGLWDHWGFSTSLRIFLEVGEQTLSLILEPANQNMNEQGVNRAILDELRLVRVK